MLLRLSFFCYKSLQILIETFLRWLFQNPCQIFLTFLVSWCWHVLTLFLSSWDFPVLRISDFFYWHLEILNIMSWLFILIKSSFVAGLLWYWETEEVGRLLITARWEWKSRFPTLLLLTLAGGVSHCSSWAGVRNCRFLLITPWFGWERVLW